MSPLFSSLGRSLSLIRQPLMALRLSVSPDEAVARCITLWRTAKTRCETPGMREQFAQTGWIGTELVIGNNGKALFTDLVVSSSMTVAVTALFPQAVPDRLKRAFLEKTFVEIIARPVPGSVTPTCELWCRVDFTSTGETTFPEDFLASMFTKIEHSFRKTGRSTDDAGAHDNAQGCEEEPGVASLLRPTTLGIPMPRQSPGNLAQ